MLVAVVGIDGSGKTTLAKALVGDLRAAGRRVRYFENAGGRPPLNWLARKLGHGDAIGWLGVDRFQAIEQRFRHLPMRLAVAWSRLPGDRIAVLDRWTVCQYAAARARGAAGEDDMRVRYAAVPAPDLTVFLSVPPIVAEKRLAERGWDADELDWLEAADSAYRSLPEWESFRAVDADRAPAEVLAEVRELVEGLR